MRLRGKSVRAARRSSLHERTTASAGTGRPARRSVLLALLAVSAAAFGIAYAMGTAVSGSNPATSTPTELPTVTLPSHGPRIARLAKAPRRPALGLGPPATQPSHTPSTPSPGPAQVEAHPTFPAHPPPADATPPPPPVLVIPPAPPPAAPGTEAGG